MPPAPRLITTLAIPLVALTLSACQPAQTSCKTALHKYDHKTGFLTWFTLYNEMRFCYDGTAARSLQWTNNRTSSPTLPYGKGGVTTSAGIETFEGSKRRARDVSTHAITCAKVLSGFDVTMRQYGYGSGTVTRYRSPIDNSKDC